MITRHDQSVHFYFGNKHRSTVQVDFILLSQNWYSDNWFCCICLCLCVHIIAVDYCLSVHWHCSLEWATTPKDKSQSVFKLSSVLWTSTYLEVGSRSPVHLWMEDAVFFSNVMLPFMFAHLESRCFGNLTSIPHPTSTRCWKRKMSHCWRWWMKMMSCRSARLRTTNWWTSCLDHSAWKILLPSSLRNPALMLRRRSNTSKTHSTVNIDWKFA